MTTYAKRSITYVAVVVFATVLVLLLRSDMVREQSDWESADIYGSARAYRDFYSKWRTGDRAEAAIGAWEKALKDEYNRLNWKNPGAVNNFINDHPEFSSADIRKNQYEVVVNDGTYDVLKRYLDSIPECDPNYGQIKKLIDEEVMREVKQATERDDWRELELLSRKYSDWSGRSKWIDSRIEIARANNAKRKWESLSSSRSEAELRRFISEYSGTRYAALASSRIDELYGDFDFVKAKGTLKAISEFVHSHPQSPRANEAWGYIANELESYVFGRKTLDYSNKALVMSLLSEYRRERPYSGVLYGGGDPYHSSPLRITTPSYGNDDYFVKLVNKSTGRAVGVYVRKGATTEVSIPDGTYSVRYATGSRWHGTRFLFGLDAQYSRASGDFTFSNGMGYTITLQKVANGNLHTSQIDAKDF